MPVQAISLMVADNRGKGRISTKGLHAAQPCSPLATVLPIIYKVAHIDIKFRILMPLLGSSCQLLPAAIIATLGVRENQSGEAFDIICFEAMPSTLAFCSNDAIFIDAIRL